MIRKAPSQQPDHVRVTFELPPNLWAARIYLVGEFNQWNAQATPLHQDRDGMWRVALDLPTGGAYEFRYLIDGRPQIDFYADSFSCPDHLEQNSVVWAVLPSSTDKPPHIDVGPITALAEFNECRGIHPRPQTQLGD